MANAEQKSTINARRFAGLIAGADIGNQSEEEASAKMRAARRMAADAGLRFIDVMELPEVKQAIDDLLSPKRSESPDLAAAAERIGELENELSERMSDVRTLADRLTEQQPMMDNARIPVPTDEANPFLRNGTEPLPPSHTGWQQGAANQQATQSNTASGWDGTAQLSTFHTAFWGGLVAVIFAFSCASWIVARPLATLDDWRAVDWWVYLLSVLLAAGVAYVGTYVNDLDDPDNIRAFLISPRVMLFSTVGLVWAWGLLYTLWAQVMGKPLTDAVRVVDLLSIVISWWFLIGRRHWQNFGVRGVVLNILLLGILTYCCLVIPSYASSSTSTMIKSVIASLVLGFPLCSDAFAGWIFESDSRFRGFAIVGAFFTLLTVASISRDLDKPAPKAPPRTATATAPDSSSEYEPEPPNSKYKWRIRKKRWIPPTLMEDARK
jgi:hypothetical protein